MFLRTIPFSGSPVVARVAPFCPLCPAHRRRRGKLLGPASAYWFYLAKTLVGLWLIWEIRPFVLEMRWAFSWEAVAVGVGVFAVWVGINGDWTTQSSLWVEKLGLSHAPAAPQSASWNPNVQFGCRLRASCVAVHPHAHPRFHWLIVPPLEEVFYRSFVYRYVARVDFLTVPLDRFLPGWLLGHRARLWLLPQ